MYNDDQFLIMTRTWLYKLSDKWMQLNQLLSLLFSFHRTYPSSGKWNRIFHIQNKYLNFQQGPARPRVMMYWIKLFSKIYWNLLNVSSGLSPDVRLTSYWLDSWLVVDHGGFGNSKQCVHVFLAVLATRSFVSLASRQKADEIRGYSLHPLLFLSHIKARIFWNLKIWVMEPLLLLFILNSF